MAGSKRHPAAGVTPGGGLPGCQGSWPLVDYSSVPWFLDLSVLFQYSAA